MELEAGAGVEVGLLLVEVGLLLRAQDLLPRQAGVEVEVGVGLLLSRAGVEADLELQAETEAKVWQPQRVPLLCQYPEDPEDLQTRRPIPPELYQRQSAGSDLVQ